MSSPNHTITLVIIYSQWILSMELHQDVSHSGTIFMIRCCLDRSEGRQPDVVLISGQGACIFKVPTPLAIDPKTLQAHFHDQRTILRKDGLLEQNLHARTPKRISQDRHKRTCCCCWSGSYKILIQEPPMSLRQEISFIQAPLRHGTCKLLMQGPLRKDLTRISTRSSVKDLYRIMQGPLRKECIRISS